MASTFCVVCQCMAELLLDEIYESDYSGVLSGPQYLQGAGTGADGTGRIPRT